MRRKGRCRFGSWLWIGLLVSLAGASVTSGGEFVLYDNFNDSARISPEKWFGSETKRPNSMLEAYRLVASGKLHLSAVGYGGIGSNVGRRTGSFGLGVKTSRPITALQAELTVTHANAQGCRENTLSAQGRAQLVAFFFHHGEERRKGDLTGEVVAVFEKVADSKEGHFIRALVLKCTSWSCSKGESIKALLFHRTWRLSEPDTMRIEWEPEASQFVFTVSADAQTGETRRITYDKALGPLKPPKVQRQRLRVRSHGANCRSGRRGVLMTASVDDVYLRFLDAKASAALSSRALTSSVARRGEMTSPPQREVSSGESEW